MKRIVLVAALLLSACASGPNGPRLRPTAQPSEVIAAELAFARLARDEGQWTAFRKTATGDAEMFVPQRVRAQTWLKGRADPPQSVRWTPSAVWTSCDGSYAVTQGSWSGSNSSGTFATVWQRQNSGGYKWVLDMSLTSAVPAGELDTVAAKVADCKAAPIPVPTAVVEGDRKIARSEDGSLLWISHVRADGARRFNLVAMIGGSPVEVIDAGTGPQPDGPR